MEILYPASEILDGFHFALLLYFSYNIPDSFCRLKVNSFGDRRRKSLTQREIS
jgi:hypothetical protein